MYSKKSQNTKCFTSCFYSVFGTPKLGQTNFFCFGEEIQESGLTTE